MLGVVNGVTVGRDVRIDEGLFDVVLVALRPPVEVDGVRGLGDFFEGFEPLFSVLDDVRKHRREELHGVANLLKDADGRRVAVAATGRRIEAPITILVLGRGYVAQSLPDRVTKFDSKGGLKSVEVNVPIFGAFYFLGEAGVQLLGAPQGHDIAGGVDDSLEVVVGLVAVRLYLVAKFLAQQSALLAFFGAEDGEHIGDSLG